MVFFANRDISDCTCVFIRGFEKGNVNGMEQYAIKGGNPLVGEVEIGGAKNAALAILAAAIMTDETVLLSLIHI